jgi:hypothetical protein
VGLGGEASLAGEVSRASSDQSEGDPPVTIPHTVVKPLCADGTALVTAWESRALLDVCDEADEAKAHLSG